MFVSHEAEKYSRINTFFTYDTFSANRAISSYRIAKLLGNERLLTKCMFCWLTVDGSEPLLGTMSEIANGIGFWDFECNIADKATPSLLRDLSNLEIMDSICHEPDHGANNYKLKLDDKGNIAHICAFDNDNPRDFYISSNLQHLLTTETKTMVTDNGNFGRNYADEILVDRLLSLTKREFYKELKPYLNCVQLYFCWSRIKMLKKAITKSLSCNKLQILKQDEWNQKMVEDEVNGLNGRTYLYVLCDWRNYYSNAGQRNT